MQPKDKISFSEEAEAALCNRGIETGIIIEYVIHKVPKPDEIPGWLCKVRSATLGWVTGTGPTPAESINAAFQTLHERSK